MSLPRVLICNFDFCGYLRFIEISYNQWKLQGTLQSLGTHKLHAILTKRDTHRPLHIEIYPSLQNHHRAQTHVCTIIRIAAHELVGWQLCLMDSLHQPVACGVIGWSSNATMRASL